MTNGFLQPTHRSFHGRTLALGIVTTLAASIAGCGGSATPDAQEGAAAPQAQALAVSPVTAGDLPTTFEAGGVVRARTTAALAARVMAPVLNVHVRAGDAVKRGATLVTLDARELTAHAAQGTASSLAADESVRAADAQVQVAEAGLQLARATHERLRGLHEKQSATAHELDQAVAALRSAEAHLSSARAQRAAASAARDAARAGAEAAGIGLSYTTIVAPFDGVVATRSVDPGAMAVPGMPLLVLEQSGGRRLEATLDEARVSGVAVGQTVDVLLDGMTGGWLPATVAEVGRIDPASHSFLVKIDLPERAVHKTGAFGRTRISGPARRALTVPASSVIRRGQLAFVFVVGPERLARLRPVSPGLIAADRAEILAGLTEHDSVVTAPPADLRDGTPIAGASAAADRPNRQPTASAGRTR
jgi:multidrug efflux pump subunit AcrA (membrane-fusion protein)